MAMRRSPVAHRGAIAVTDRRRVRAWVPRSSNSRSEELKVVDKKARVRLVIPVPGKRIWLVCDRTEVNFVAVSHKVNTNFATFVGGGELVIQEVVL
jgi:hypothetical protein